MKNKIMQLFGLLASMGTTSTKEFREKKEAELDKKPETAGKKVSFSQFAEGINPNALSMKRKKGKWIVKK